MDLTNQQNGFYFLSSPSSPPHLNLWISLIQDDENNELKLIIVLWTILFIASVKWWLIFFDGFNSFFYLLRAPIDDWPNHPYAVQMACNGVGFGLSCLMLFYRAVLGHNDRWVSEWSGCCWLTVAVAHGSIPLNSDAVCCCGSWLCKWLNRNLHWFLLVLLFHTSTSAIHIPFLR